MNPIFRKWKYIVAATGGLIFAAVAVKGLFHVEINVGPDISQFVVKQLQRTMDRVTGKSADDAKRHEESKASKARRIAHLISLGTWVEGDMPADDAEEAIRTIIRFDLGAEVDHSESDVIVVPNGLADLWSRPGFDRTIQKHEVSMVRLSQKSMFTISVDGKSWKTTGDEVFLPALTTPDGSVAVIYRIGKAKALIVDDKQVGSRYDEIAGPIFRPCDEATRWCVSAIVRSGSECSVLDDGKGWNYWITNCTIDAAGSIVSDEASNEPRFLTRGIFEGGPLLLQVGGLLFRDDRELARNVENFREFVTGKDGRVAATVGTDKAMTLWVPSGGVWNTWYDEVLLFAVGPGQKVSALVKVGERLTYVVNQRPLAEWFAAAHIWTISPDGKMIAAAVGDRELAFRRPGAETSKLDKQFRWRVIVRKIE